MSTRSEAPEMSERKSATLELVEKWRSQVVIRRVQRSSHEWCFLKAQCAEVNVFVSWRNCVREIERRRSTVFERSDVRWIPR